MSQRFCIIDNFVSINGLEYILNNVNQIQNKQLKIYNHDTRKS